MEYIRLDKNRKIAEEYTTGDNIFSESRKGNHNGDHSWLIADKWFLKVESQYNTETHKLTDTYTSVGEIATQDIIPLSQEELDEVEANQLSPLEQWKVDMIASDAIMPRNIEDIWDVIGIENALDEKVQDNYAEKKAVRALQPIEVIK